MTRRWMPLALCFAGMGCATVPNRGGFDEVAQVVEARTGHAVRWNQGGPEDADVEELIRQRLKEPLTMDAAVEISLLNNRGLQAIYEDLGIAQADLVQAGLLKNPSLSAVIGIPFTQAVLENEVSLVQDFLDLLVLPLRKQMATVEFERAKRRVGDAVLHQAGEVRTAWWSLVTAEKERQLLQDVLTTNELASDLANRQHEAGNINDLEQLEQRQPAAETRLALARAELNVKAAREQLITLLGLWGQETAFRFSDEFPALPKTEPAAERLEASAMEQRLDLAAARSEVASLGLGLSYVGATRVFPAFALGVTAQQASPEGLRSLGPTIELGLPIFDQGQARVARGEALQRQALNRLADLAVHVRSEVRVARARLNNARASVEYFQGFVLPLREQVMEQTQLQYNAMQIGLFHLLDAKRSQVNAYREYIDFIGQYWTARSDLEVALGGRLPDSRPSPTPLKE